MKLTDRLSDRLSKKKLDEVDMTLVSVSSFMNLSSSLTSLTLEACQLNGRMSNNIFHLPNLRELNLKENRELMGGFPNGKLDQSPKILGCLFDDFFRRITKINWQSKILKEFGIE